MWKLTVIRTYKLEGMTYEREAEMYFEAKHLDELVIIIDKFNKFATDGTFEYKITKEEGEAEC